MELFIGFISGVITCGVLGSLSAFTPAKTRSHK